MKVFQLLDHTTPTHTTLFNITNYNPNYLDGNFRLKQTGKKTKIYKWVYAVFYKSIEVAKLYLDNILNPDLINLKIEDYLLYDREQTETIVNEFLHTYQLQINNFSALDIFIDCRNDLIRLFDKYYEKPTVYHFVGNKKSVLEDPDNVYEYNQKKRSGLKNPSYYIGSSDKKLVCIYNKTKELNSSNKAYIVALHELSLTGNADVYRFELRLKNKYFTGKEHNLTFNNLYDTDFLKSFVKDALDKFIDFRKMDNPKITRCTKIDLFDLSTSNKAMDFQIANKVTQNSTTSTIRQDKISIKYLINRSLSTGNRKYLSTALDIAMGSNLMEFYNNQMKGINLNKPKPMRKPDLVTDIDFDF